MPSIRHAMKIQVWDRWIGEETGKTLCLMCEKTPITQLTFVCAHVLAHSMGGEISVENLRPLCGWCNSSMGTQHMTKFSLLNFPKSPLIITLPLLQSIQHIIEETTVNQSLSEDGRLTDQNMNPNNRPAESSTPEDRVICPNCDKSLKNKESLRKHLSMKRCISLRETQLVVIETPMAPTMMDLYEMMKAMKNEIATMKASQPKSGQQTHNQNNNLNVMCLTNHDDLLEILTLQGTTKQALTFVKNCALAKLAGDCKILQRVYFPPDQPPALMYANKTKSHYVYFNEKHERVIETNPKIIAKMLAENVQRSYLKGAHNLKDSNGKPLSVSADHPMIPVIEEFDLQSINSHIYELDDERYQTKLLKSLKIPFESEV
jgi:hypothetical protein